MRSKNVRRLQPLVATAVLAVIVMPIAIAAASGPESPESPSALVSQIKALKKRISALEAKESSHTSLPRGPAGGDFAGQYPNPQLRANAIASPNIANGGITSADIADNTITSADILDGGIGSVDIADGTIGQADLGPSSVGASQLVGIQIVRSPRRFIAPGQSGGTEAICPSNTLMISGGGELTVSPPTNAWLQRSEPKPLNPNTWLVTATNESPNFVDIFATALCLKTSP